MLPTTVQMYRVRSFMLARSVYVRTNTAKTVSNSLYTSRWVCVVQITHRRNGAESMFNATAVQVHASNGSVKIPANFLVRYLVKVHAPPVVLAVTCCSG